MHIGFLNPQGNFDSGNSHISEHPDFGGQLIYVREVAMAMALSAGASEYLVKPADLAGFPALIQAILAHIAPGEHPSGEPPKL